MKVRTQIKKIPRLAAFAISIAFLAGGIFLINKAQIIFSGAVDESSPHQIKISNITDSSFTVSWTTEKKTTGRLVFGKKTNGLNESKVDTRDQNKSQAGNFITHFIQIDNLTSETKYYFKIVSAGRYYDNSSKPYEVTTAPRLSPTEGDLAQGTIYGTDDQPAIGAMVYFSLPNTIIQAAITDSAGHWIIPLSTARTSDLKKFSNYDRSAQIAEISVQGENDVASATLTTGNDNPTPEIKLGQSYNFQNEVGSANKENGPTIVQNQFPGSPSSNSSGFQQELTISSPEENESINTFVPEFFGTGPKGQVLEILVESDNEIAGKTTAENDGKWKWSSKEPLPPGDHKITVSYVDQKGFVQKVTHNFIVLAANESNLPSFTATPSGEIVTPTLKISPTSLMATPTVKIMPSVTILPTISATPTLKTTLAPTPTVDKSRTTIPSGKSPTSGNGIPTWVFFGGGIMAIISGILLLL